jgi:hypothetical protein
VALGGILIAAAFIGDTVARPAVPWAVELAPQLVASGTDIRARGDNGELPDVAPESDGIGSDTGTDANTATAAPSEPPAPSTPVAVVSAAAVVVPNVPVNVEQLTPAETAGVLAASGWPVELIPGGVRVAACESGLSPGALSYDGTVGLMQLWPGWFPYAGLDAAQWADPVVNAKAALAAYQYHGNQWSQWGCAWAAN